MSVVGIKLSAIVTVKLKSTGGWIRVDVHQSFEYEYLQHLSVLA